MSRLTIPWAPRVILTGRVFRLPVQAPNASVHLDAEDFALIADRWCDRDSARYFYLRSPNEPGDYVLKAYCDGGSAEATVQVRSLAALRRPHAFNGAQWPRRWPLGKPFASAKARQTLQDMPIGTADEAALKWWTAQPDAVIWKQLPPAELPRAHFVNVHQGSPTVGTAVFKHGGFYPWRRSHLPCDFKSVCPESGDVFPSNDLANGDCVSGDFPDDGYGYFDAEGHVFLFAATYARDQVRAFGAGIATLTQALRTAWNDETARTLGLMLLRYAVEECYVAAVPQFRYGPSKGEEEPWNWGQPDWAVMADPVAALNRIGSLRYSIDTPYIAETVALAYDTVWPFLKADQVIVDRARALGVDVETPADATGLLEEMLACLLQCVLDRAAGSNLPRESQGALALLRALDRPDAQDVMTWLYDEGPDVLRVFTANDFFPDGTPPEATGGYNGIHTNGVFDLEYHLRQFRAQHPGAYPESRYPSLMNDPRAARIARAPHEIAMCGKTWFQFGDGSAPGTSAQLGAQPRKAGAIAIGPDCFHAPMAAETLARAAEFTGDPVVSDLRDAVQTGRHRKLGSTVLDGVGLAVLRTGDVPERAAVGIAYGDATGHRHRDLLDVQLVAFGRPFLTDLGYPQSWASISPWEAHWATHNTVWGALEGDDDWRVAGRGRVVRTLFADGIQVLEVAAERWVWAGGQWTRPGVKYRRLIALVETDGEGVALVDLSRIRGGATHWRMCRGLEGDFMPLRLNLKAQPGTVAGMDIARGQVAKLTRADEAALAYLDDVHCDEVGNRMWRGRWVSRWEPNACLDVYQLQASADTTLFTARATAIMGTPEASNYCFRSLLWRRTPASDDSCIDLVFEPHLGAPTLSGVWWSGTEAAPAVRLKTRAGREIVLYWAPDEPAEFPDGTRLGVGLGAVIDGKRMAVGATQFGDWAPDQARVVRRILALNRDACTVDVDAIDGIGPGDRVVINPDRGHMYAVTAIERLPDGRIRLTFDMTSVLGRGQIARIDGDWVILGHHVMARTGHLHGTRLQPAHSPACAAILAAHNPDRHTTAIQVNDLPDRAFKKGDWVQVVDYAVGERLVFEPLSVQGDF